MIPLAQLQERRRQLLARLPSPALLFAGGPRARNTPFGEYPFRADSNFLLFFAHPEPSSAAFFDPDDGSVTLFLPERTELGALWDGDVPSFAEVQAEAGVDAVLGLARLDDQVAKLARGRSVLSVATADPHTTEAARRITGLDLDQGDPAKIGPAELVDALAALRLVKAKPEIAEIRAAAEVTREAFLRAMAETRPGVSEQQLTAVVDGTFLRHGCASGYQTILSIRGEVLHNHAHGNVLSDGDLLLVDAGAERPSGYGADVTRTWPASGSFTPEQRAVYEVVRRAHADAVDTVRPGVRWAEVHRRAAETIARGLVDLRLLHGRPQELVARGAHAVFFPHGVGHFLGLDTHDLRVFGDRILYPGATRSAQFGTDMLRMNRVLEPGMVVTVEPGVYFVPAILRRADLRERFAGAVDFERAVSFTRANGGRGFGGVRLEDDVIVTGNGREILTPDIPLDPDEVEAGVGTEVSWP
jgi:Xaa-Pro aminopeptidase